MPAHDADLTILPKKKKKTLKVTKLTSCMNFRMIQAVMKCFERSTVERIEENHRRTSRGGEGGCSPPSHKIFEIFRAKRWWFGQKYSGENTLKVVKARRLVKTELKSNDLRIQVFVLEKPYIVYPYGQSIWAIKQGRIKANETLQPRTKPVKTHYKNTYFCT